MSKIVAIVQARMSSSRFPGKVLKPLSGVPVLSHVFNQLSFSRKLDDIVLTTSNDTSDDQLQQWAEENNRNFFRGDLDNVLNRFYETSLKYKADVIVRITGDCPLIDPSIVDKVILGFFDGDYDYYSNANPPTFPDGLDTEVFSFPTLETAYRKAKLKSEQEHVTPYIRNHPELFKIGNLVSEVNFEKHRWTLDNQEDYEFLSKIFESLYKPNSFISWGKVISFLKKNKDLQKINAHIERNEGFYKSLKEDIGIK